MLVVWCDNEGFGEDSAVTAEKPETPEGKAEAAEEYCPLLGEGLYVVHVTDMESFYSEPPVGYDTFTVTVWRDDVWMAKAEPQSGWEDEELTDADIEIDLDEEDWL